MGDRAGRRRVRLVAVAAAIGLLAPAVAASAQTADDPRAGLGGGYQDAETASWNMELLAHVERPAGFVNPNNPGDFGYINSDMAFSGHHAFVGSYAGVQIWDISEPAEPELAVGVACPGGQGDVSVSGDLMFVSVQERGTRDCTSLEEGDDAFVGVRVFDISDLTDPQQIAAVETCRGSHTHTVVEDPDDPSTVYVYVNGTSGVRSDAPEGLDCEVGPMTPAPTEDNPDREVPSTDPDDFDEDTQTDRYQIEVIAVPVASPEDAEIVNEVRLFADEETGNPVGLQGVTDACHDITAYPAIGLAAGACEGNGLLIDISDPADPVRVDYVEDTENFRLLALRDVQQRRLQGRVHRRTRRRCRTDLSAQR